jgi:hypothetical protein
METLMGESPTNGPPVGQLGQPAPKRAVAIGAAVLVVVVAVIIGVVWWTRGPITVKGPVTVEKLPNDINRMSAQDAIALASPAAKAWKSDAVLSGISSAANGAGESGRSDDWDLLFVSPATTGRGYRVTIRSREIAGSEEISFVGAGATPPANIASSQEAIDQLHGIPGYENEPVLGVEVLYGPDGNQWYWGVKTARGVVTVKATK